MINETRYGQGNARTLAEIVAEIQEELKDFLQTRVPMLISELRESVKNSKSVAILGGGALLLLATAWLLLHLALVGLVAVAFWGSAYAWFFSFLIVGLFWAIVGRGLGLSAQRQPRGLAPRKTIKVLKQDKIWLRQEARSQIGALNRHTHWNYVQPINEGRFTAP